MPKNGQTWIDNTSGKRVRVCKVIGAKVYYLLPGIADEMSEDIPSFLLHHTHRA